MDYPEQIIDMKGLMGDIQIIFLESRGRRKNSHKVVKGISHGRGTVIFIEKVSGNKLKEKLTTFKEQAVLSKELATIMREAPVDVQLDDIYYEGFERRNSIIYLRSLGFSLYWTSLAKILYLKI